MAYSSSIKRAQAIKLCELCEEESIKWRCIECDLCLCEKCKKIHMKVPATAQHQIVTIETPLQEVQKKIATYNIPCKDHPIKMVCLFCRSCDCLICPDCVSSSHKGHNFDSIESALEEKLDQLKGIQGKVDTNLKSCQSKTSEVQGIKQRYNAIFDESLTKIKQKEQELIDVIRQFSKDLQEQVENERSRINRIISKIQQDIDSEKKILKDQREEVDAVLNSNQGNLILNANMIIKDLQFDSLPNQVEEFIPGTKSIEEIQKLFGALKTLSISTIQALPELEVLRTFTTNLPYINTVATLDEISAWISCDDKPVIKRVNIQDNNITTSQEVSLDVCDMAVTLNDELLLTPYNESVVKLLKKSGEIVSFITVAPLLARGIHVTKNNDIILGVREPGNPYTLTEQSQRAVIVYDKNGKEKQRFHFDPSGKRLLTVPHKITSNFNQDILVVDDTSSRRGRVVVLNKEGKLRWVYEGHDEINSSKKFDPRGIVTTTGGHIVVSDYGPDAIHVLSEDGDILACQVMTDMGITYTWGLSIDNEGKLWLGCDTGGKKIGAKLHVLKFTS